MGPVIPGRILPTLAWLRRGRPRARAVPRGVDRTIVRRYESSRRRHPLSVDDESGHRAGDRERGACCSNTVKARADVVVDTSGLHVTSCGGASAAVRRGTSTMQTRSCRSAQERAAARRRPGDRLPTSCPTPLVDELRTLTGLDGPCATTCCASRAPGALDNLETLLEQLCPLRHRGQGRTHQSRSDAPGGGPPLGRHRRGGGAALTGGRRGPSASCTGTSRSDAPPARRHAPGWSRRVAGTGWLRPSSARYYARATHAVVATADARRVDRPACAAPSTCPAPGDLRRCIEAMAGDAQRDGEERSTTVRRQRRRGSRLGNLLLRLYDATGDFVVAVDELSRLVGIDRRRAFSRRRRSGGAVRGRRRRAAVIARWRSASGGHPARLTSNRRSRGARDAVARWRTPTRSCWGPGSLSRRAGGRGGRRRLRDALRRRRGRRVYVATCSAEGRRDPGLRRRRSPRCAAVATRSTSTLVLAQRVRCRWATCGGSRWWRPIWWAGLPAHDPALLGPALAESAQLGDAGPAAAGDPIRRVPLTSGGSPVGR